ncbi:hypothetical protein [Kitasatospora sp. NPDC017646]|uniref:hypothetical protein n=1 Tax=Kitasatospora sp. NPDC017646 TaxID=3364024 RepID=UPI0037AC779F
MTIDPDTVPASPVYTITLTSSGTALLDGAEIPVPPGADLHEARVAALREVQIKAALRDRPVRAIAKEPTGTVWHLIVSVDGRAITLAHPHPRPATPAPQPPPAAPPPPPVHPQPQPPQPRATAAPALAPQPVPPQPRPFTTGPVTSGPPPTPLPAAPTDPHATHILRVPKLTPPPAERLPATTADNWSEPFTGPYALLLTRIRTQEETGDHDGALLTAEALEDSLTGLLGDHHPQTVNALGLRAWLTLRHSDWAEAADLLLLTIERRRTAGAPAEDTGRLARDAHLAWRKLAADDPEYALEIAGRLVTALDNDEKRRRHVISWVESGAVRPGPVRKDTPTVHLLALPRPPRT